MSAAAVSRLVAQHTKGDVLDLSDQFLGGEIVHVCNSILDNAEIAHIILKVRISNMFNCT